MEALIRLLDGSNPDPASNPLRGYIVVLKPDGHVWGRGEGPPEYGVVVVPGIDPAGQVERERPWRMRVDLSVTTADYAADAFTLTIAAQGFNARTGEGKVTLAGLTRYKVEQFLANWGATGISAADNAVSFNVRIADAYQSNGFWKASLAGFTFNEVSYDQATGVHRVRITYPATLTAEERDAFRQLCTERVTFVSINTSTRRVTADISRSTVRDEFIEEVRTKVNGIILRRRRYRLSESMCRVIEAAGGYVELSAAQLSAAIVDHLTE